MKSVPTDVTGEVLRTGDVVQIIRDAGVGGWNDRTLHNVSAVADDPYYVWVSDSLWWDRSGEPHRSASDTVRVYTGLLFRVTTDTDLAALPTATAQLPEDRHAVLASIDPVAAEMWTYYPPH
jgi:hypothetical protein